MKKYPDFWHTLLGDGSVGAFLAFIVLAYICAIVMILWEVGNRDTGNPDTPKNLSVKFFCAANLLRLIANLLLIPIFIRLSYQYLDPLWMLLFSIGIGLGVNYLGKIAKQYGLLTTNKLASKIAEKINNSEIKNP